MDALSTRLRPRVPPGATGGGVVGRHGDAWKLRVAALAETGGRTLVSGHGAREKLVRLTGFGLSHIERRLTAAAGKERAS